MAVIVHATVQALTPQPNGSMKFGVLAKSMDGAHTDSIITDEISPSLNGLQVNTAIAQAVRAHAETEWELEFDLLDTVLILGGVTVI